MADTGEIGICQITVATVAERGEALAVLLDAVERQAEYFRSGWDATSLATAVDRALPYGELYLARLDGKVIGAFVLGWKDEPVWGPPIWGGRPDEAGYVHKLAVARRAAGQGVGLKMQRWAEERVREAGRLYLRLDCDADNVRLNRYYRDAGFSQCGVRPFPNGGRVSLYQKAVD